MTALPFFFAVILPVELFTLATVFLLDLNRNALALPSFTLGLSVRFSPRPM